MASSPRHRGLTLVEVLLVLTLLVVIGALATPFLEGSFARASLQNSGDLLRGAWSRARIAAMESGQTHVFRYEQYGSRYQIATLDALSTPEGDPPSDDAEDQERRRDPSDFFRLSEDRLPDGIVFAAGDIAASNQVAATLGESQSENWSAPILFHADGATSDATVILTNDSQQTLRVTLRGLTGISNSGEVGREEIPVQ